MRGKKNDFSMTFYFQEKRVMFIEYVHDTDKAIKWLNAAVDKKTGQNIRWDEVNIYNRRNREFIEKIKNI